MVDNELSFGSYEDPQNAAKVWETYEQEVLSTGLESEALKIIKQCGNSLDLDARLDLLITGKKSKKSTRTVPPANIDDVDADGLYSKVRRGYEESR